MWLLNARGDTPVAGFDELIDAFEQLLAREQVVADHVILYLARKNSIAVGIDEVK